MFSSPRLLAGVLLANRRIREMAREDTSMKGMGTTLVGGIVEQDHLATVNVGDSRLYRVRENKIGQITVDHSLVGEKRRNGTLTDEEAKRHPQKHILTSALGAAEKPKIDLYLPDILPGDVFIICSDGVHNSLEDDEILSVVCSIEDGSLYKMGLSLVLKAKLAGGLDDMTVLLLSFDHEEKKES
ncbi:MAG: serine/threonine-protein phosphatase [Deltaproteobacteria bacterium]|nr:serine/threonine-protein phosphatase [Deltaproteobacteria bacterium]